MVDWLRIHVERLVDYYGLNIPIDDEPVRVRLHSTDYQPLAESAAETGDAPSASR